MTGVSSHIYDSFLYFTNSFYINIDLSSYAKFYPCLNFKSTFNRIFDYKQDIDPNIFALANKTTIKFAQNFASITKQNGAFSFHIHGYMHTNRSV